MVIADDHVLLRQGVVSMLEAEGFDVVGQAGDAEDLVRKVGAHRPDVAIIDIRMPPTNTDDGLRAAVAIRRAHPDVGVLVLSQYIEADYALELIGGDARGVGYLLKDRISDIEEFAGRDQARGVRRFRARPGGRALDARAAERDLGAVGADAARARGARAAGAGMLERGRWRAGSSSTSAPSRST